MGASQKVPYCVQSIRTTSIFYCYSASDAPLRRGRKKKTHVTERLVPLGNRRKNKRSIPLVAMHSDRDEMPKHKLGKEKQPLLNPNEKARIFVAIRCFFLWVGVLGEGM